MVRYSFLFVFIFFMYSLVLGQNVTDNLVRMYQPNSYRIIARADHYLKTGSFVFLENESQFKRYERSDIYLGNSFPFRNMSRNHIIFGYEHKAGEKWYAGGSVKYIFAPDENNFFSRVNISHRGDVFKLKFIKEAALEHVARPRSDNPYIIIQNYGRFSFAPSLVKKVNVFSKPLFLILHYRAFLLFDFNNDGIGAYKNRKIDRTELRVEADYRISDKIILSLFGIRETDYSYRIETNGSFLIPEARVNKVTPAFGISINFVMNAPEDYIPGFPVK